MVSVRQQDHLDLIKFYFQLAVLLMTLLYSSILNQPKKKDDQIPSKENKRQNSDHPFIILLNVKLFTVILFHLISFGFII